jgi:hypothetical protein
LICITAWVWGAFYETIIWYDGTARLVGMQIDHMGLTVGTRTTPPPWNGIGWHSQHERRDVRSDWVATAADVTWIGFAIIKGQSLLDTFFVRVPHWFLTCTFAGITAWVWRKTRRKEDRGFAVEPRSSDAAQ